jgi:hypothetical protein
VGEKEIYGDREEYEVKTKRLRGRQGQRLQSITGRRRERKKETGDIQKMRQKQRGGEGRQRQETYRK